MRVEEVMTRDVVTVPPGAAFAEIVDRLLESQISGVPVVDEDGSLVGVITEADLVAKEAYPHGHRRGLALLADYLRGRDPQWVRKASGLVAADLMTAAPMTATPDEDLASVARRMLENDIKRCPVLDGGRLVGIVCRQDLLKPFHRPDSAVQADVEAALNDALRVPEDHELRATVHNGIVQLVGTTRCPSDLRVTEAALSHVAGVVGVQCDVTAREPEPRVSAMILPPLR